MTGEPMKVSGILAEDQAVAVKASRAARSSDTPKAGRSFAAVHERALAAEAPKAAADVPLATAAKSGPGKVSGVEAGGAQAPKPVEALAPIKPRKGEAMTPVEGHSYSEITAGGRDGMFVNTSANRRRGDAFVLAFKNGIEYHIYGAGKDRVVVALKPRKDQTEDAPATAPRTGGTTPTVSGTGPTGVEVPTGGVRLP